MTLTPLDVLVVACVVAFAGVLLYAVLIVVASVGAAALDLYRPKTPIQRICEALAPGVPMDQDDLRDATGLADVQEILTLLGKARFVEIETGHPSDKGPLYKMTAAGRKAWEDA